MTPHRLEPCPAAPQQAQFGHGHAIANRNLHLNYVALAEEQYAESIGLIWQKPSWPCSLTQAKPMQSSDTSFLQRTVVFVLVALTPVLVWYLFDVVLIAVGAIVLATLLRLGAKPLRRWLRLPESIALTMSILFLLASVGGIAYLFGAQIANDLQNVIDRAQVAETSIRASLQASEFGKAVLSHIGGADYSVTKILSSVFSITTTFIEAIVVLLITGVYLAAQPEVYIAGIIQLFPPKLHKRAADTLNAIGYGLRLWLIGQIIQMFLIGLLSGIAVWLIGLPSPLALGLIAGAAEFIPYIGPIIASIPAILVAATKDLSAVIWTIVAYLLIHQIEGDLFVPLIQRRMVYIPPAVILLGIATITVLFGSLSIIFAAPIVIIVFVAVKKIYIRDTLHGKTDIPGDAS
ncbi:MAG: AI-2E family transporter [Methylocella sp.]